MARIEDPKRLIGSCISTTLVSMRKRKKESLWFLRYSIRHSQGNAITLIEVQPLVKEAATLAAEETVVVGVVLLKK